MGTWGTGAFENDDACDWTDDLEPGNLDPIRDAFAVLSRGGYLEAPDAVVILAAAEIVAAAAGHPSDDDLPDDAQEYVDALDGIDPALVAAARAAVERVLASESELAELWAQSDSDDEWRGVVTDLRRRLAAT